MYVFGVGLAVDTEVNGELVNGEDTPEDTKPSEEVNIGKYEHKL